MGVSLIWRGWVYEICPNETADPLSMRLLLVDPIDWDYNLESVYQRPLGGSQSAFCYLAEALAHRGHQVTFLTNTSQPGLYRGVGCRAFSTTTAAIIRPLNPEVCIVL